MVARPPPPPSRLLSPRPPALLCRRPHHPTCSPPPTPAHPNLPLARSRGGRGGGRDTADTRALREENERVVGALVAKTMELALLSEAEITLRRELARAKEVNMKLVRGL